MNAPEFVLKGQYRLIRNLRSPTKLIDNFLQEAPQPDAKTKSPTVSYFLRAGEGVGMGVTGTIGTEATAMD